MNYFVYMHRRVDKDEIFYIGKGKIRHEKGSERGRYERAYSKGGRSKQWSGIVSRTNYEVEIYATYETEDEAFDKEIELISFYGRKLLGGGTLINLDKGGVGSRLVYSKQRGEFHVHNITPVYAYNSFTGERAGSFNSIAGAMRELKIGKTSLYKALDKDPRHLIKNFVVFRNDMGDFIKPVERGTINEDYLKSGSVISMYDESGVLIESFSSIKDAKIKLSVQSNCISKSCFLKRFIKNGKLKGYFFSTGSEKFANPPDLKIPERVNKLIDEGYSISEIESKLKISRHKIYYINKSRGKAEKTVLKIKKINDLTEGTGFISLYSPNGNIHSSYKSVGEACNRTLASRKSITNSLKFKTNIITGVYSGYFWRTGNSAFCEKILHRPSEKIINLLEKDFNINEISEELKMEVSLVRRILRDRGFNLSNKK